MNGRTQIVLLVLTALTMLSILRLVRSGKLKAKYSLLWISLGVALLALAALPNVADNVAEEVGVYYQPALFFVVGIGFLLLVVIHFSYELSRMENRVRTLTEETTLIRHELVALRDELGADLHARIDADLGAAPGAERPAPRGRAEQVRTSVVPPGQEPPRSPR
jgi:hypothetical protein